VVFITTFECSIDVFDYLCPLLCLSVLFILQFLKALPKNLMVCRCIFRISRSSSYIKVTGSRSQEQNVIRP